MIKIKKETDLQPDDQEAPMSTVIPLQRKPSRGAVPLLLLILLLFLPPALAEEPREDSAGKRVTLPADQVVDEDYFAAGEVVEIR
ncbi:MAG TPA: hypothetical protein VFA47_09385, partial [Candidatus Manganitrophaceae bacterium]|nr:hypothetical protein [Candidatus Manganitrophaceae bacterium]